MDISLSPDNENFIQNQIAAGIYKTINEAVNAAINIAFIDASVFNKRINEFNKEIEKGLTAMENGDVLDGQSVIDEFRKKYE